MSLQLADDFFRVLADLVIIGADQANRDRLRCAEAHDLAHDVARLESEGGQLGLLLCLRLGQAPRPCPLLQPLRQPRNHPLGEDLAKPLTKLVELDATVLLQGDAQPAVVRPAHEQHHVVDAEVGGDLTYEAHRDRDILWSPASCSISWRHLTPISRVSS